LHAQIKQCKELKKDVAFELSKIEHRIENVEAKVGVNESMPFIS
jgi:hypothetical protein